MLSIGIKVHGMSIEGIRRNQCRVSVSPPQLFALAMMEVLMRRQFLLYSVLVVLNCLKRALSYLGGLRKEEVIFYSILWEMGST